MRRILPHIIIALALALLSGSCRSQRHTSGGVSRNASSEQRRTDARAWQERNYAFEETDEMGSDLVAEAKRWIGTPYRYGGKERSGTDCSGLVMQLYNIVCAVKLPRTTREQRIFCMAVPSDKTRVGDLLFFSSPGGKGSVSHVGLYIGKGEMIHASTSRGVVVSSLESGYWNSRFQGVGRVSGAYKSWASTDRGKNARKKTKKGAVEYTPSSPADVQAPLAQSDKPTRRLSSLPGGNSGAQPDATPDSEAAEELDNIISQKIDSIFSSNFMD